MIIRYAVDNNINLGKTWYCKASGVVCV